MVRRNLEYYCILLNNNIPFIESLVNNPITIIFFFFYSVFVPNIFVIDLFVFVVNFFIIFSNVYLSVSTIANVTSGLYKIMIRGIALCIPIVYPY